MKAASIHRVIGVAAGLCVSFVATFWLLSILSETSGIMNRLGLMSAFFCAFGALMFFWAAGSACVIQKMGWTYRACRYVGFAFLVPGSALFLSHGRAISIAYFLTVQITLSAYICRRLVFPKISDEQIFGPEPLPTMFPK